MGIDDESSHPRLCSEVADGVTRNIVRLFREPDAVTPPVRFDKRGLWKRGMVRLLRHRQTKGPGSARLHLNRRATPRLHLKTPLDGVNERYGDDSTTTLPRHCQGRLSLTWPFHPRKICP